MRVKKSESPFGNEKRPGTGVKSIVIQLAKKISCAEQEPAWICGKNISKSRLRLWQKRWNAWTISFSAGFRFHGVSLPVLVVAMACSIAGAKICKMCGKDPTGKASGLAWIHGTWCACAHHPAVGMSRGSVGHTASCSSSFIKKEPVALTQAMPFEARCLCGSAQGVCADWFAPFGCRRRCWVKR